MLHLAKKLYFGTHINLESSIGQNNVSSLCLLSRKCLLLYKHRINSVHVKLHTLKKLIKYKSAEYIGWHFKQWQIYGHHTAQCTARIYNLDYVTSS